MAALQDGDLHSGLEKVLETNRAILMHGVLYAHVRLSDLVRVATPTSVAVEVVLATTNPAYSALVAVEDQFLDALVVPEVAVLAKVGPEDLSTGSATLRRRLSV
jgi:hypothetical protein